MKKALTLLLCFVLTFVIVGCNSDSIDTVTPSSTPNETTTLDTLPEYSDSPFVAIEDNVPDFTEEEITDESFERYSPLDNLGRCGVTFACVGKDIMPTEERGAIGQIKPTGWHTVKYDFVDGKYLYNRCHLIGFQLTGENANVNNLITGTRYFNVEGMLPFEDMVADYVRETENHVMYRVTPIYKDKELVARGVRMEALSVEDNGDGVCFDVFVYNVQPGVFIDYATGESRESTDKNDDTSVSTNVNDTYVLNTNSKKFHKISCGSIDNIKDYNKKISSDSRDALINQGYSPCKSCNP